MRQLLIVALLVAAAAATASNCSTVTVPSASANYYMPPKACVDNDASLALCFSSFSTCIQASGATCATVESCFAEKARCLEGTAPTNGNCTAWESSLENFGLYLIAGGSYKDSSLDIACQYALCGAAQEAFKAGVKTPSGNICPVNLSAVCIPPNFEPPTRAPGQPLYTLTFGGAEWEAVLAAAPKGSEKYKALEKSVAKGLAKLLAVLENLITILGLRTGSMVVDFIVNSDKVSVDQIKAKLNAVVADPSLASTTFTELAAASGVTISVTGAGVQDFSTPAPATPAPTPSSAVAINAIVAVLAVLAALLF